MDDQLGGAYGPGNAGAHLVAVRIGIGVAQDRGDAHELPTDLLEDVRVLVLSTDRDDLAPAAVLWGSGAGGPEQSGGDNQAADEALG